VSPYEKGLQARFWAKVARGDPTECWPWQGYIVPSGHGMTTHQSLMTLAHRKAWILTNGPIRGALCVNHRCDNAACCNPAHLYLGTRADNMVDRHAHVPPDLRGSYNRSTVLTGEQIGEMYQMRRNGATLQQCSDHFGVHRATVARYVTERRRERLQELRDRTSVKKTPDI
jgi:hypothetical protein